MIFWRTTHMDLPLAGCDPNSVAIGDVIATGLSHFTPIGQPTNQESLRFKPDQQWYHYCDMVGSEVVAFEILQSSKSNRQPGLQTVFILRSRTPARQMRQSGDRAANIASAFSA